MEGNPVRCNACGGEMTPEADGRTYVCLYCRARVQVAVGADQIARGMALDLRDMGSFLDRLAGTVSRGFTEHAKIETQGAVVVSVEITLEPDVFVARRDGQRVVAQHLRVVRGIRLKTNTMPLDRWLAHLTDTLARHANESSRAAWLLNELIANR